MEMKFVWNSEWKRIAALLGAVYIAILTAANLGLWLYKNQARAEYKALLASFFGNMSEVCPEMEEEELVQILGADGNQDLGYKILARYGVYEEYASVSFSGQERRLKFLTGGGDGFLVLAALVWGRVYFRAMGKRQEKIAALENYMESLARGEYRLKLEDNGEDELSGLRNEIYKLTVLLREQAEQALVQRAALADAVADISHQIKTPLTSVTVLVDNLSSGGEMDSAVRRRFLAEIARQLSAMNWLVAAMLKRSRLDAGVVEFRQERLKMAELVQEVLDRLEMAAEWRGIEFEVQIPAEAAFRGDRRWTAEALLNIVKNGVEHSPQGGRIRIQGEENQVYAQIEVADQGAGLTSQEREKLFGRFYNRDSSREDSVGLGLALAKEIVEKQGGYILVDSQVGAGTIFQIRFLKNPHPGS